MRQLIDFADTATEFCSWAEGTPDSVDVEADLAIKFLTRLIAQAQDLPNTFDEADAPPTSHEEWQAVFKRFGALPFNYYACYAEPHNVGDPSPCTGCLADDLADIWRDLKGGLALFNGGNHAGASCEWRESFRTHWGRHAAGALYALQCWRA